MRVLVTGVAGFIGSVTAKLLIESNFEVVGIDNFSNSTPTNVPDGVQFIESDIADTSAYKNIGKLDGCLHFAGSIDTSESMVNPHKYYENNVTSTFILLKQLERLDVQRIVFSSSAAVYGNQSSTSISENSPECPTSVYGHTKLIIDQTLEQLSSLERINSASLRYFNAAGSFRNMPEGHLNEKHLIPCAIDAALGKRDSFYLHGNDFKTYDGTCIRDYVHVEDLARAHIYALDYLSTNNWLIANLGTGIGFSNLEIIDAIEKISGSKIPVTISERRPGDPDALVADISHAKTTIGWTPNITVLEAINDAVNSRR